MIYVFYAILSQSLVVYRLVHPPVTRESGVRLPAEEDTFFSGLYQVDEGLPVDARSDLLCATASAIAKGRRVIQVRQSDSERPLFCAQKRGTTTKETVHTI